MGKVIKFRRRARKKRQLPQEWQAYTQKRKSPRIWQGAVAAALLGILIGIGSLGTGKISPAALNSEPTFSRRFGLCHTGGGINCVVDGDTLWMDGKKIRVADIDAPETHPPRCPYEEELGNKATARLRELLNDGPFTVHQIGGRDEDGYGRDLRVLKRDGISIGGMLVEEGLVRPWTGQRRPWC